MTTIRVIPSMQCHKVIPHFQAIIMRQSE